MTNVNLLTNMESRRKTTANVHLNALSILNPYLSSNYVYVGARGPLNRGEDINTKSSSGRPKGVRSLLLKVIDLIGFIFTVFC